MAVATFFAFLATTLDAVPNTVKPVDDLRLMTQPDGMLVRLSNLANEAVKEIGVFALLHESD